jgi:hypothetical protein
MFVDLAVKTAKTSSAMLGGALSVGMLLSISACGGSNPPPVVTVQTAPPPPTTQTPPPPTPPPPAQVGPCDATQAAAMTLVLGARQKVEAPNMKPESSPACSVLQEGAEAVTATIQLQPDKCYTILIDSNLTEVEASLRVDPKSVPPAAAALFGNNVTLATMQEGRAPRGGIASKTCFNGPRMNPLLKGAIVPGQLYIKAVRGSGPVAAQVFEKKL